MGPKGIFIPPDFLRFHRNRLAMLQRELAEVMGVNEGRIRHLEAGSFGGVRQPAFRKLAELLRTDVNGLRQLIAAWEAKNEGIGPVIPPEGFGGVEPSESGPSPQKAPRNGAVHQGPDVTKRPSGDNLPGRRKKRRRIQ